MSSPLDPPEEVAALYRRLDWRRLTVRQKAELLTEAWGKARRRLGLPQDPVLVHYPEDQPLPKAASASSSDPSPEPKLEPNPNSPT